MSRVITFEHRGVRAAIPATQALDVVGGAAAPSTATSLWTGRQDVGDRWLRVRVSDGECSLRCAFVELREVPGDTLMPISAVLSGALQLPHVIGLAEISGQHTWLVDMRRYRRRQG